MTGSKDNLFRRPSRGGRNRPWSLALLSLLGLTLSGCVALQPLADAMGTSPPGRHLPIDGKSVYIEESGSGEPLVLVHGFGGSTFSWRLVIPDLAQDYRVIAVDLLGFGFSDRPREPELYTRTEQVELLTGVLGALDLESAHWAGHSYGGGLVTTLAYRHPELVRSLILIASTAPEYAERRRGLAGRPLLAQPFVRGVALRPGFIRRSLERSVYDDSLVSDQLVHSYLERLRIAGAVDAYVGLTSPARKSGQEQPVDISQIAVPVLALWGEKDSLITAEDGRGGISTFPDHRFVAIPDCGHLPAEERPDVVAREMRTFLGKLAGGSAEAATH